MGNTHEFTVSSRTANQMASNQLSSGSKHWSTITIPHTYIGSSWPIRVIIF